MGKKNKSGKGNLGKALVRDRFGPSTFRNSNSSMLHTSDINDGYEWGRLNLQSVTEESSFQEFLSTAELAGTEFHAEKLNIKFVNPKSGIGLLSRDEQAKLLEAQEEKKELLKIPRRPKWDSSTTIEDLQRQEREAFLEWRRALTMLQEVEGLMLTPYEKNLEFWRQLWRVVERSDIVVQIVDARNPLLFRCEDLERYVKEIESRKMNMILINKADFLTDDQRAAWAQYFSKINLRVAFFSATEAAKKEKLEEILQEESEAEDEDGEESNSEMENSFESNSTSKYESAREDCPSDNEINDMEDTDANEKTIVEEDECNTKELQTSVTEVAQNSTAKNDLTETVVNSAKLLSREELISLFKTIHKETKYTEGLTTVGLVGYPNVGKSSTINALLMDKKVSVSATPGKTKHFQTLFVDKELLLCDCPGLVMPSFVCTKAEMVLNGILPIDQMRDHVAPITLLGTLIPRHVIEDLYGIMIPLPLEGEDPDRSPTAEEILNAYGFNRGFMTQNGQPDNPRSARYLLKDFVNGKLLYSVAPPGMEQETYHIFPPRRKTLPDIANLPPRAVRANNTSITTTDSLDKAFFQSRNVGVHVRGRISGNPYQPNSNIGSVNGSTQSLVIEEKPWKKINRHTNKKKREKTRRLFAHLDQH